MDFATFVHDRRRATGLTLQQFCDHYDFDPVTISGLEIGLIAPPCDTDLLTRYADALHLKQWSEDWMTFISLVTEAHIQELQRITVSTREQIRQLQELQDDQQDFAVWKAQRATIKPEETITVDIRLTSIALSNLLLLTQEFQCSPEDMLAYVCECEADTCQSLIERVHLRRECQQAQQKITLSEAVRVHGELIRLQREAAEAQAGIMHTLIERVSAMLATLKRRT